MISSVYLLCLALTTTQPVLTASIEPQLSAAADNRSILRTEISPEWVTSPRTRGTSDILWSCIITLTACVYTALHLNIPPEHEGRSRFYLRKLKWVAIALLAPEIVLYCALVQCIQARRLTRELNILWTSQQALLDHDLETSGVNVPPKKFSFEYGFFIVMGGIATQAVGKIVDDEDRRLTLTPEAVLFFARDGVFFDIPPEVISDKSKANLLGKGLVCAQVTWFFTQLLTRVAAEYPLALIEIHTVVHVVCALSMYVLWWKKPQDISEPVIQDISADHLGILTIMVFFLKSGLPSMPPEACTLFWVGKDGLKRSRLGRDGESDDTTEISAKEALRWSKFGEWIENYNRGRNGPNITRAEDKIHVIREILLELAVQAALVINSFSDQNKFLVVLTALSATYGGIHLTAWNFHFASQTEQLLWKIACFDIIAFVPSGLLYVIGAICLAINMDKLGLRLLVRDKIWLWTFVIFLLIPYTLARMYIVVEAFISLHHVPIGVYAAVPWVQPIPHV